jgi:antitoxin FitA
MKERAVVSTLVIPDLDEETLARLRAQAADRGRSEAEEARRILAEGLRRVGPLDAGAETLADAMRAIFTPLGGHDFPDVRERGSRPPPDFSGPEYGT